MAHYTESVSILKKAHGDCMKKVLLFFVKQCNRFQSVFRSATKLHQCFYRIG